MRVAGIRRSIRQHSALEARPDYIDIKRDLVREPIFNSKVHSRMARLFLGEATVEEMMEEARRDKEPAKPQ